jgi:capsule polysaccharide modification protein KpsS
MKEVPPPLPVSHPFGWSVLHTIFNSLGVTLGARYYPNYRHHRDVNTARQAMLWARSGLRKAYYGLTEKHLLPRFEGDLSRKYFLVGLQVYNDYQVKNSRFSDVADFIEEVVRSFAKHAPPDLSLVLKHHPADRAYRDYGDLLKRLAEELGLFDRVYYVHDLHLPTLMKNALGTVVINSTIGWSSLHHQTPVLALDEAIYGFMGLNASCSLDEFWRAPPTVDPDAVATATAWLRRHNQANGSVWTRLPSAGRSGILWPEEFCLNE